MPQMTGGQALARSLHREGIRTIFGLPGVQLYHALGGLLETPDIRFVNARHEQGTTYMADGFARVADHAGIAMVVPGPGMLNASAGLSDAYAASSPVMLISGQIGIDKIGKDTGVLHEINDQLDVARTITKWCSRILDPTQIPAAVHEAFRNLNTGRPRPVEIEIPPETLAQTAEIDLLEPGIYSPEAPDSASVDQAAALLAAAERPVIWAGGGVIRSGASGALARLAELLQAPVINTPEAKGAISSRSYLSLGTAKAGQARPDLDPLHRYVDDCDLILAVGTRFATHNILEPTKQVVQIDIDPQEAGRNHARTQAVVGDARVSLDALYDSLHARGQRPSRRQEFEAFRAQRDEIMEGVLPQHLYMQALRDAIPDDGVIVVDSTQVGYHSNTFYPVFEPGTYINSSYQGNLGFAFPTALGAKVALPDKAVVSLSGDGGFMFNVQELATAVHHGINMVAVVFNDSAYGNVLRDMNDLFDGNDVGATLHNPDFVKLAEAFGVDAMRAHNPSELYGCLKEALSNNRPTLIEAPVDKMPRGR